MNEQDVEKMYYDFIKKQHELLNEMRLNTMSLSESSDEEMSRLVYLSNFMAHLTRVEQSLRQTHAKAYDAVIEDENYRESLADGSSDSE